MVDLGGHSQKVVYAFQECLLGEGFEKHRLGRATGNDIHGDTVHVPGNVEDPDAGVFADEIGGEVEATLPGHDHVEDGQIGAVLDGQVESLRAVRGRELTGCVYFIMLTVHAEKECLVRAFEAGVDDFITKPLDPGELFARLRAATRVVGLLEELAQRTGEAYHLHAELDRLRAKLSRADVSAGA